MESEESDENPEIGIVETAPINKSGAIPSKDTENINKIDRMTEDEDELLPV